MQRDELDRTRIELENSLSMYAALYDFAPVGYLTLGRDSKIQQTNLTATKLLGVDRSGYEACGLKDLLFRKTINSLMHCSKQSSPRENQESAR